MVMATMMMMVMMTVVVEEIIMKLIEETAEIDAIAEGMDLLL